MMRLLVFLFVILILTVFGYWINENTSAIYFDFFDYTVEISFLFALFVLIIAVMTINYGVKLIVVLLSFPEYIKNYFINRNKDHLVSDLQKLVLSAYVRNATEIKRCANSLVKNKCSATLLQKSFIQFVEFINSDSELGEKEIASLLKKLSPEVKDIVLQGLIQQGKIDLIDLKANIDYIVSIQDVVVALKSLVMNNEKEFALKYFSKLKSRFSSVDEYESCYQAFIFFVSEKTNQPLLLRKALECKRTNDTAFAQFLESKFNEGKSRFTKYVLEYMSCHSGERSTSVIGRFMDSLSVSEAHELGMKLRSQFPGLYEAQLLYIKSCLISGFNNEAYAALSELYSNYDADWRAAILKAELAYRAQGSSSEIIDALKKAFLAI